MNNNFRIFAAFQENLKCRNSTQYTVLTS